MSRQDNSDPLPYVQVDRAVKPKATLLANALGVSTQHALGSLVEWWELCGDPRELETIVAATRDGEEPAVVLKAEDAALRFKLASGKDVEPVVLVRLGLLEPRGESFRVRGMSRYFEPIERRMRARDVASMGGRASAESRRKATGTAQPVGGRGSVFAQPTSEAEPNRQPKRNRTDNRTATEPTTEAEPNTAVSGQRSSSKSTAPARESDLLLTDFKAAMGTDYLWNGAKDGTAFAALKASAGIEEIRARWRKGLAAPADAWASCRTVSQLRAKWNDLATKPQPTTIDHAPSRLL